MCTCDKCRSKREKSAEGEIIQRQMVNAANELDILSAMLTTRPDRQRELRIFSDMLAEWSLSV